MKNSRAGQPVIGDFPCPFPCGLVSLAALFKCAPPEFSHTVSEHHEGRHICRHSMVGKETPDHLLKPLPLLGNGMVSSLAQLLLDFPKFRTAAVALGLPFKLENSPAGFAADQREAQKIEGLRFAETALLAVMHCVAAELDQP